MKQSSPKKVGETFAAACEIGIAVQPVRQKVATKVLSIRLTEDEYAHLSREAGKQTISRYARYKLFDGKDLAPEKRRKRDKMRIKAPDANKTLLGQVLGLLGSSDIAPNLREIGKAARLGALSESPETIAVINRACSNIDAIHRALIRAMGVRS